MILDNAVPRWDVRERHSTRIACPPAETLAAARAVTPREVPAFRVLMALRSLPAWIAGRRPGGADAPLVERFKRMGFTSLGESGEEVAYCGVGRFWQPSGGLRRVPAHEFGGFAEAGYAKVGFNFVAEPAGGGSCVLTTETRIVATDAAARRRFKLYWKVVYPGSALIRRAWLRAIRARAERATG